ncbi:MAG: hypothetical protein HOP33_02695 [Verrucomicrobia bacterium]|nr:hypothetical protein [Verrucomicrobiota bacterium]
MRRLRNILMVLAAVLWLPLSAHCLLERIPAFQFLACNDDTDAGKTSDCDDTGCCPAEKTLYRINQIRVSVPSPDLLPLLPVATVDTAIALSAEAVSAAVAGSPPELPQCWQFVFRTASPPRAPSFTS